MVKPDRPSIDFSLIIPVCNEEEVIIELHRQLEEVLPEIETSYEVIFIDDGSNDSTWEKLCSIHSNNPAFKALRFSRNFGHHYAITAGFDLASGNSIGLMDADLQDSPQELKRLYHIFKEEKNVDLVYAVRSNRKDGFLKKLVSFCFWKMIRLFTGMDIPQNQSAMRIMSRTYKDAISSMRESSRFLAGIFVWVGFNKKGVPVSHQPRFAGKSKYSLHRQITSTLNAITSFTPLPLRLVTTVGVIISTGSFIYIIFLVLQRLLFDRGVQGWLSLIVAVFFMGGMTMFSIGVVGEYVSRIFLQSKDRPLYIISENLGDLK